MAIVLQHKVVAALPLPLEPDSIYYVRVGQGFDQYITNGLGETVAYKSNVQAAVERAAQYTPALTAGGITLKLRHISYGTLQAMQGNGTPLNLMVNNNGG